MSGDLRNPVDPSPQSARARRSQNCPGCDVGGPLSTDHHGGRGLRMTLRHQPPCPGGRLCRIPGLADMHNGGVSARADRYATHSLATLHVVRCACLLFSTVTLKLSVFII